MKESKTISAVTSRSSAKIQTRYQLPTHHPRLRDLTRIWDTPRRYSLADRTLRFSQSTKSAKLIQKKNQSRKPQYGRASQRLTTEWSPSKWRRRKESKSFRDRTTSCPSQLSFKTSKILSYSSTCWSKNCSIRRCCKTIRLLFRTPLLTKFKS